MNYDMKSPCAKCPFRRGTAMLLRPGRIRDIERMFSTHNGGEFPCHETVDYNAETDHQAGAEAKHCAGALIYAEQQGVSTQMMRIVERLGMYDRTQLADAAVVWADLDEWLEHGSTTR